MVGQPQRRSGRGGCSFTLTDQFGQPVSLSQFRGKVVVLAFIDPQCTTICPLTTTAMVDAKAMLGAAASRVQLLGIDANPTSTNIADVRAYSEAHGMVHRWDFLTGPLAQLKPVWKAYGIEAEIVRGQIDHTPALYVIGPRGRLIKVYMTQMAYTAVRQLRQVLAQEASKLLPDRPPVRSHLSYAKIKGIPPSKRTTAPRAEGGTVALGPGRWPRLYLFFATWDQEVTNLDAQLEALNSYQAAATAARLPALTAIDEASVEPSPRALSAFLAELPHPLTYPVARAEFGLFADASVRYGRQVAFLGADANDNSGDAQAFLAHHPVSYPSYQTHLDQMTGIVPQGLLGTPTTIFMNRAGRVVHVHTGQYESQGALDGDIRRYALGE